MVALFIVCVGFIIYVFIWLCGPWFMSRHSKSQRVDPSLGLSLICICDLSALKWAKVAAVKSGQVSTSSLSLSLFLFSLSFLLLSLPLFSSLSIAKDSWEPASPRRLPGKSLPSPATASAASVAFAASAASAASADGGGGAAGAQSEGLSAPSRPKCQSSGPIVCSDRFTPWFASDWVEWTGWNIYQVKYIYLFK